MIFLFTGTDTAQIRENVRAETKKHAGVGSVLRITDANTPADLEMALRGGGMFDGGQVVVCDNVCANEEMDRMLLEALPRLQKAKEIFFIIEASPNAATRKRLEKYAETTVRFDAAKLAKKQTIFALANALQKGNKKELWVGYQRELADGKAPEAIHGVLFWAAKQYLLRSPTDTHARRLVATLAALPHEARRERCEMEYAIERFILQ